MGSSSILKIKLKPLEDLYKSELHRLFGIDPTITEGYLVEEVFGWSRSRLIFHENELVGLIQIRKLDLEKGHGVLGTWLVPIVWGTGINQAAKLDILDETFTEFPLLNRVYFSIEADNVRSLKAAEKLAYALPVTQADVPEDLRSSDNLTGAETRKHFADPIWFVVERERFFSFTLK